MVIGIGEISVVVEGIGREGSGREGSGRWGGYILVVTGYILWCGIYPGV